MALIAFTLLNTKNGLVPLTNKLDDDNFYTWKKSVILTLKTLKFQDHFSADKIPPQFEATPSSESDSGSVTKNSASDGDPAATPKKTTTSTPQRHGILSTTSSHLHQAPGSRVSKINSELPRKRVNTEQSQSLGRGGGRNNRGRRTGRGADTQTLDLNANYVAELGMLYRHATIVLIFTINPPPNLVNNKSHIPIPFHHHHLPHFISQRHTSLLPPLLLKPPGLQILVPPTM
ncbi:hypothetical protein PIB30_021858 [Stylosanthes scabra]|uniref:Retrotransposon Copia-like N-terminal domain-containing protein n=1 Tax=Stylosanthes scabra TaxID=79078 RepID=A0ABU6Q9A5_9FABA|nr:hypothetical protein [Stylosanthes scabra]